MIDFWNGNPKISCKSVSVKMTNLIIAENEVTNT
jgi:hypothetical protein